MSCSVLAQNPPLILFSLRGMRNTYLLQRLVVNEACSILGNLELAFLDLLAKLPGRGRGILAHGSSLTGREERDMQLSATNTRELRYAHNSVLAPAEPGRAENKKGGWRGMVSISRWSAVTCNDSWRQRRHPTAGR
jgi:hypothetical protein